MEVFDIVNTYSCTISRFHVISINIKGNILSSQVLKHDLCLNKMLCLAIITTIKVCYHNLRIDNASWIVLDNA